MRNNEMLDALFPRVRQMVLATLMLQPEQKWYLSDLAQTLHLQPSSLQRELASLTEAGILRREPDGNRVYYRAEPNYPLLPDLQQIFTKTIGVADKIKALLQPFFAEIDFAFIYGSVARGERTAQSDVDLMIIGSVQMSELSLTLRELEYQLRVPVNVTHYAWAEFSQKFVSGHHFIQTIMQTSRIFIKGSKNELDNALSRSES